MNSLRSRSVGLLLGAVFALGVLHKMADTCGARSSVNWLTGSGYAASVGIALLASWESWLCVELVRGARVRPWLQLSTVTLLAYSALLAARAIHEGWTAACDCFGLGLPMSLRFSIGRNLILAGIAAWGARDRSTIDSPSSYPETQPPRGL